MLPTREVAAGLEVGALDAGNEGEVACLRCWTGTVVVDVGLDDGGKLGELKGNPSCPIGKGGYIRMGEFIGCI